MDNNTNTTAKHKTLYCKSLFAYRRRPTVEVQLGKLLIGGNQPIRIQTMLTTSTADVDATVSQCIRLADAGAELVRITAPSLRDAEALKLIRDRLRASGCKVPLVADIHFNPEAALLAARYVEKVRINPGNFTDKQAILSQTTSSSDWNSDLDKLRIKFLTLLNVCREHGTALRIGSNHGSLSGRIMSRYGDTPAGMVESAMEFLRICKSENFKNVLVSMKSSNTRVMIQAYRLLVATMDAEDMHYPLHLGVTEAGDGEDGRIKSAVGIGALLADGLGDTIRVSLTEDPANEIPVARSLVHCFAGRENHKAIAPVDCSAFSPYEYSPHKTLAAGKLGGDNPAAVVADLSQLNPVYEKDIEALNFTVCDGALKAGELSPDLIYSGSAMLNCKFENMQVFGDDDEDFIFCDYSSLTDAFIGWLGQNPQKSLILETGNVNGVAEQRAFFMKLAAADVRNPVIIRRRYKETDFEQLQIRAACDLGALLVDGFGAGIMISNENDSIPAGRIVDLSFRILQASRVRYTRTEYIACPGCGRTLFDLRETLARVKTATAELKGLKIGVMGCIVNGPGEMADADFGYVGAGPGRVTLYRGKEAVKKNIPQEKALNELIDLINASK